MFHTSMQCVLPIQSDVWWLDIAAIYSVHLSFRGFGKFHVQGNWFQIFGTFVFFFCALVNSVPFLNVLHAHTFSLIQRMLTLIYV